MFKTTRVLVPAFLAAAVLGAAGDPNPSDDVLILGKVIEKGLNAHEPRGGPPAAPLARRAAAVLEEAVYIPGQGGVVILSVPMATEKGEVIATAREGAGAAPTNPDGSSAEKAEKKTEGDTEKPAAGGDEAAERKAAAPARADRAGAEPGDLWAQTEKELRDGGSLRPPDAEAWMAEAIELLRANALNLASIPEKETITVVLRDAGLRAAANAPAAGGAAASPNAEPFVQRTQVTVSASKALLLKLADGALSEKEFRKEANVAVAQVSVPAVVNSLWPSAPADVAALTARWRDWAARQGGAAAGQPGGEEPARNWRWQRDGGGGGGAGAGGGGGRGRGADEPRGGRDQPAPAPAPAPD